MSDDAKPLEITHDSENNVFLVVVDGVTCELEYRLEGTTMNITHTGVPQAVGGRGIAALLTQFAVQVAEAKHWKVRPACSYAQAWFQRNPAYGHLLA